MREPAVFQTAWFFPMRTLIWLSLVLLLACGERDDVGPGADEGPFRADSVELLQASPEEQERTARGRPRCALPAMDSGWIRQADSRGRVELRVPPSYATAPYESEENVSWLGSDSSVITLDFLERTGWVFSSVTPADSVTSQIDDGWCSARLAGRIAAVARYRLITIQADTFYVANVSADIKPGVGLLVATLARTRLARDQFLTALGTLRVMR